MATRELLSPAQRAQMLCIPDDLSDQLLARYYTFSDDDLALIKQGLTVFSLLSAQQECNRETSFSQYYSSDQKP